MLIEDKTVEICGVLIGELYKDDTGPYLEIIDIEKVNTLITNLVKLNLLIRLGHL